MDKEVVVKIESISNLGAGIAHYDGKVVFVEGTCPEDVVLVRIVKDNKKFSIGEVVEIQTPSSYRTETTCPLQKVCGSCQFQYIDYDYQLKIKQDIVQDCLRWQSLKDIPVLPVVSSPKIWEYRHKIQMPVSETKNSKRIVAGYFKKKSHEIVNIKYCPIQPAICDEIIEFVRKNAKDYNVSGYYEPKHIGDIRHILMRVSALNSDILLTLVINSSKVSENIKQFAQKIYDKFDVIKGVCVNLNDKKTNLILSEKTFSLIGDDYIIERLCGVEFKVKTNTFFQVNPYTAENIFNYVKDYIKENFDAPVILDAYAGIATIGIIMSDVAKKVVSVEENKQSIETAREVLKDNDIQNVEVYCDDTSNYLSQISEKMFDITILDPPRKGCSQVSLDKTLEVTKSRIIYISCNPQTLARDLDYLKSKGARVCSVQPFDMFCHSNHVESVAIIEL